MFEKSNKIFKKGNKNSLIFRNGFDIMMLNFNYGALCR